MNFKDAYAHYYNSIYQDKNYTGEVDFILSLLNEYQPNTESILELGCGTGSHALILAEKGYQVDGVDLSPEMLKVLDERIQKLPPEITEKTSFWQGDIQSIRTGKKYDAVISLFHVMSYQTSNEALNAAFETAKEHLNPGGIFLFDCWYGPAVLSDRPVTRIKRLEDKQTSIVRIAEPGMSPNENLVEVNYQIFLSDRNDSTQNHFHETHSMRYLFQPEVKTLLEKNQLNFLQCREWITNNTPGFDSWNVYFLSQLN